MAILVLVLWLFTAGAGFSLLASSNLSRTRPSAPAPVAEPAPVAQAASTPTQAPAEPPRRPSRDRFAPP